MSIVAMKLPDVNGRQKNDQGVVDIAKEKPFNAEDRSESGKK